MAQDDLGEIKQYITKELNNPSAAVSTLNGITDSIRVLRDFPLAGASLASISNTQSDYRFLGSGNYIIFYRFHDEDVYIDRILYGRRDYQRVLFGENTVYE